MASITQNPINEVVKTFHQAGYETIRCDSIKRICFDIIANKSPKTVITKVVSNIDSIPEKNMHDMRVISYFIDAVPLIIGEGNRRNELEENTVYYRNNIVTVNFKTLHNLLIENIHPYLLAKRGSLIAKVDGNVIKNKREELSISRRELSEILNVTPRTIAEYERGVMKSSAEHVRKMEKILKISVTIPMKILENNKPRVTPEDLKSNKPDFKKKNAGFLEELFDLFEELGIQQFWTSRSPFDVFLSFPDTQNIRIQPIRPIVSSIFPSFDEKENGRLLLIKKMIDAVRISGTAIVEDPVDAKKCKIAKIPVIEKKELKEIKDPKEFKKLVAKKI